jgi:sulfite reductase (NADPH) hemoprotein beta-component
MAELGFVGKAPGKYNIMVGGSAIGTRMNRLYRESVKDAELIETLRPVLQRFAAERIGAERFGDWAARVLWPETAATPAPAALATAIA